MSELSLNIDTEAAVARLMRFLAVEGVTGQEKAIGDEVARALAEVGVPADQIRFDCANEKIPLPTQTGNLIATLPGTVAGPRRLFMTHLDTVPLCAGARPVREADRIRPDGPTALGGDNRTGCACLVTLAATLLQRRLPHPPLTLLFTVREESGLWGARNVDLADLGHPVDGCNIDGGSPAEVTLGAVGAERWDVEVLGKASHAGAHPEHGVSATVVASLALAKVYRDGWFGKVVRDGREGTSNVGSVGDRSGRSAGNATNVVTDFALIKGEARSHDAAFVSEIVRAYREAFEEAAAIVRNHEGRTAEVRFTSRLDYHPFRMAEDTPVVLRGLEAVARVGLAGKTRTTNGGLDANWMVRHGVPTITIGAGQRNVHTVDEYVEVADFLGGCRVALAMATA